MTSEALVCELPEMTEGRATGDELDFQCVDRTQLPDGDRFDSEWREILRDGGADILGATAIDRFSSHVETLLAGGLTDLLGGWRRR